MTTAIQLLLVVSAATGFVASAVSERSVPTAEHLSAPVVQEAVAQERTALEEAMSVLKTGQRALRKQIKTPAESKGELLTNLAEMEAAAHAAIVLTPKAMATLPEESRAAQTVAYKQKMTSLLVGILSMEAAALSSDMEALAAAYEEISATKKSGHTSFRD